MPALEKKSKIGKQNTEKHKEKFDKSMEICLEQFKTKKKSAAWWKVKPQSMMNSELNTLD